MERDWVVWIGSVLLFFCGIVFSKFLPVINPEVKIGVAELIALGSAVATAIAAYAAWRAADISRRQADESAHQNRWQMYKTHQESFFNLLDDISKDLKIEFFQRHGLYDELFPDNRDINRPFNATGGTELPAIRLALTRIADYVCHPHQSSPREVLDWIGSYMWLQSALKYSAAGLDMQLYADDRIPTGISLENYSSVIPVMDSVVSRICRFAYLEYSYVSRGVGERFNADMRDFINTATPGLFYGCRYREPI